MKQHLLIYKLKIDHFYNRRTKFRRMQNARNKVVIYPFKIEVNLYKCNQRQ